MGSGREGRGGHTMKFEQKVFDYSRHSTEIADWLTKRPGTVVHYATTVVREPPYNKPRILVVVMYEEAQYLDVGLWPSAKAAAQIVSGIEP